MEKENSMRGILIELDGRTKKISQNRLTLQQRYKIMCSSSSFPVIGVRQDTPLYAAAVIVLHHLLFTHLSSSSTYQPSCSAIILSYMWAESALQCVVPVFF